MKLKEIIKTDLRRLSNKDGFLSFLKWYFFPKGSTFPHDVWLRILCNCKKNRFKKYTIGLFAYIMERRFSFKYSIFVNSNADIGPGLKIVHGGGVYLNCEKIGANFTVYQGVTLGSNGKSNHEKERPIVMDDVCVFANAVVVGRIVLKNKCIVGANSFVNHDVEEGTIVAGLPAKIIKKDLNRDEYSN